MRIIAAYWLTGCVLVGIAIGVHWNKCHDDLGGHNGSLVALVAIWPAAFVAALVARDVEKPACEQSP